MQSDKNKASREESKGILES